VKAPSAQAPYWSATQHKIGKLRRISHAWITEFLTGRLSKDDTVSHDL
jgi:hypothetical protein